MSRYIQKGQVKHPRGGLLATNMTRVPYAMLDFGAGMPFERASDMGQYHGGSLYAHAEGMQVRLVPRPASAVLQAGQV